MKRAGFMEMGQLEKERSELQPRTFKSLGDLAKAHNIQSEHRQAQIDWCVRKWWHILKFVPRETDRKNSLKPGGVNHLFCLCVQNTFKEFCGR